MNYRTLIILAVLIALPFGPKAQYEPPDDTAQVTWEGSDHPIMPDSIPTFVVFYIDTVGWKVVSRSTHKTSSDPSGWGSDMLHDPFEADTIRKEWEITEIVRRPKIHTIIVGRFRTDADPKQVKDWRVRIAE